MSRRLTRMALAALACIAEAGAAPPVDRVVIVSPDSSMRIALQVVDGRLHYDIRKDRTPIIESSRAGVVVGGVDLGDVVSLGAVDDYRMGDRANGARVTVTHLASGLRYGIDLRAYTDGAAFRMIVPASGARDADVAASFTLPAGSIVLSEKRPPVLLKAKLPDDAGLVAMVESAPRRDDAMASWITTPWRIVIVARDAKGLANSEIARDLR